MSTRRRLVRNVLSLTSARMAARVANMVVALVVARSLGKQGYGVYSAAFAFTAIAAVLTDVGTGQVLLRAGARRHPQLAVYLGNSLLVKAILVVVVYVGMLGVSWLLGHPPDLFVAVCVLGLSAMSTSGQQLLFSLLLAREDMHLVAVAQTATSLLALSGTVGVAAAGGDLLGYAWVQVVAAVVPFPWVLLRVIRETPPRSDFSQVTSLLREGVSFGLGGIFYLINLRVDIVVMTSILAASVVGVYAAAYRIVSTIYFLPAVVSAAVIPRLFREGAEAVDRHRRTAASVLRYQSLFGGLAAAALYLASGPVIRLLYGAAYDDAASLLRLLCWLLVLQTMSYPLGDVLTTVDRNGQRVAVTGAAAALNLTTNLLVIPVFGAKGAALTTLGTELFTLLAFFLLLRRYVPDYRAGRAVAPQVFAVGLAVVAGDFALGFQPAASWFDAGLALVACGAVAAVLLVAFGFFPPAERRWLLALLRRK